MFQHNASVSVSGRSGLPDGREAKSLQFSWEAGVNDRENKKVFSIFLPRAVLYADGRADVVQPYGHGSAVAFRALPIFPYRNLRRGSCGFDDRFGGGQGGVDRLQDVFFHGHAQRVPAGGDQSRRLQGAGGKAIHAEARGDSGFMGLARPGIGEDSRGSALIFNEFGRIRTRR